MNIFELTKLFWRTVRTSGPNAPEALFFFYLIERCSLGDWQNPFPVPTRDVALEVRFSNKTLTDVRSRLKNKGLIDFKAGQRNSGSPLYCFPEIDADGQLWFPWDTQNRNQNRNQKEKIPDFSFSATPNRETKTETKTETLNIICNNTGNIDYSHTHSASAKNEKIEDAQKAVPPDPQTLQSRRAEARVQSAAIRADILSRSAALEALAVKHRADLAEITEAIDDALADWNEAGVVHITGGRFDLANALQHLRRLLPVKLGINRRDRDRDREHQNPQTRNNENRSKDKYADRRAAEPDCQNPAEFDPTF